MTATSTSTGTVAGGRVRRGGLALVMIGALSVSVRGQVEAVEPLLGGMSLVLALTNDLAALLALNELMSTKRRDVRRWAWAVLVLAGGTAAGLNTWHAVEAGALPALWAVVVGIGPVLLAVVLSHLVALVLNDAPTPVPSDTGSVGPAASAPAPAPEQERVVARAEAVPPTPPVAATVTESSRAAQAPPALGGPGVHHGLSVVPAPRVLPAPPAADARGTVRSEETDPRVRQLAALLRNGADLTGATVAEELGCSPRTGRRLLRLAEEHLTGSGRSAPPGSVRGTG